MNGKPNVGPDRKYQGMTYAEWLASLKPGDAVRVRYPWEDRDVPGGRMDAGEVVETQDGPHWRIAARYLNSRSQQLETTRFYAHGSTGYRRLEHPDIDSVYNPDNLPDQSSEFMTSEESDKQDAANLAQAHV